jgi:hypothetical protein
MYFQITDGTFVGFFENNKDPMGAKRDGIGNYYFLFIIT